MGSKFPNSSAKLIGKPDDLDQMCFINGTQMFDMQDVSV